MILCSFACLEYSHLRKLRGCTLLYCVLQVMEKLVDIVHFLHLEIHDAFGSAGIGLNTYFSVYTCLHLLSGLNQDTSEGTAVCFISRFHISMKE